MTTAPAAPPSTALLQADRLHKQFVLHNHGTEIPVLAGTSLTVHAGECIALQGPSGSGKSTFMRSLYGNYRVDRGAVHIKHEGRWVNLSQLAPHELIDVRRKTLGYVSQFLRVIPRVPALDVAAEPLIAWGADPEAARDRVSEILAQLNLPQRLWHLSPTTFSGGEKQRVNIARAFAVPYPVLLLDEPTSALDAANREVVMALIEARLAQGCGLVGIFHDHEVRDRVCNRTLTFGG